MGQPQWRDVQMPAMDGFEVIEQVSSDHLPIVVFVTAHDRYALPASTGRRLFTLTASRSTPAWHGDFDVTLRDGTLLRLSRSFRGRLVP
jgi:DNA-binding LytR/AlgR family response regulator